MDVDEQDWVAFAGTDRFAAGAPPMVARLVRERLNLSDVPVLVFDRATGRVIDLDLRGSPDEVAARYGPAASGEASASRRERGRPRLGVIPREVTLLPRHWDWLSDQPGGASAALRRLVDAAIRNLHTADRTRRAAEAAYRFMSALAGDLPAFEEASRALFAADQAAFDVHTSGWPPDVREELDRFLEPVFANGGAGA